MPDLKSGERMLGCESDILTYPVHQKPKFAGPGCYPRLPGPALRYARRFAKTTSVNPATIESAAKKASNGNALAVFGSSLRAEICLCGLSVSISELGTAGVIRAIANTVGSVATSWSSGVTSVRVAFFMSTTEGWFLSL